jgi:hypothetical protein
MEMMMIASPAFEKLLAEFGSPDKITAVRASSDDVVALLLRGAAFVGYLRWLSLEQGWGFKFEGIRFSSFVSRDSLEIDVICLIKEVHNHSRTWVPAASEIAVQMEELGRQGHDLLQVCCGHDVCEILGIGLRKVLGSQNIDADPSKVERALRLAYEYEFLLRTELFAALKAWERKLPRQVDSCEVECCPASKRSR